MYTFDTNALIYHLHDEAPVRALVDKAIRDASPLYISTITITELLRFPGLAPEEETAIADLLLAFSAIPVDSTISTSAGQIGRMYRLKLADSIIAATALFTGSILVTRNIRDFKRMAHLDAVRI